MKIIHLVPSMESGGVEQVVLELGKAYASQGIDNIVISAGGRLVSQLEKDGSTHIEMPIGKKSLKTLFQISKLTKLLATERPDIIHIHSRVPGWVGFLANSRLPKESRPHTVTSVHGFYSVNRYSAIMTKGERVIAVSECIKNYILKNYPNTSLSKIKVISNSIDPTLYHTGFKPEQEWLNRWEEQFPELQDKYVLCLPGRITRLKGHLELIPILQDLIARGIPAHALIVGEAKKSKQAYKQELVTAYEEAGLSSCVTWAGHRSDLINILSISDIVLSLTTSPESFGKTTLEALALGKHVIGYDHGGVKEQLEKIFPDGLIPLGNSTIAAEKIAWWFNNPPCSPAPIPKEYCLDGMIEHHLQVYQELIDQK